MLSIDLVNAIKEIAKYIEEKKNHDPALYNMFMSLRDDVMGLVAEHADLMAQVQELKAKNDINEGLEFSERYGIHYKEENGRTIYYCMKCKAKDSQLVPLKNDVHGFTCGACGQFYDKPEYEPPSLAQDDFRLL